MSLDHVLLTRFNLPSAGFESIIRAQEGWLRGRAQLFEEYCLPSVRAQSNKNFHWLIYFDPESPSWLKDKIKVWSSDRTFEPVFREQVSHKELIEDIRSVVGIPSSELMTTNLDNDDGIAVDFVQRLQNVEISSSRSAIYISQGLIKCGDAVYIRADRQNAFCSVRESWETPVGCWTDFHNRLGRHMSTKVLEGPPGWLQVIHGTNVSNRVRGRRVSPGQYRSLYLGLLDEVAETTTQDLLRDWLFASPYRIARETARAAIKRIIESSLGKNGGDHVKFVCVSWAKRIARGRAQIS